MTTEPTQIARSARPPAQPSYILRGHTAQIHALHFFRQNLRLLSGDADGWVVLWDVPIRRPVAVWRAHDATVLGLGSWGDDRIFTHGRDNRLLVWQLGLTDEKQFSTTLPIEDATTERKKPWLMHSLTVNALNFCSFAYIRAPAVPSDEYGHVIIALPGFQDGAINLTSLPSESRMATIPPIANTNTGMLMAVALRLPGPANDFSSLIVLAGYESGHVALWSQPASSTNTWQALYTHQTHTQPVLSVAIDPVSRVWYSSSADAIIGRHSLSPVAGDNPEILKTKHAGQQSLCVRNDAKIFATAGWDGRGRVYSTKAFSELAVLKWHKEGMYAATFADVDVEDGEGLGAQADIHAIAKRPLTIAELRTIKTQSTHWLAAGSKDGKVSLWDIY